MSEENDIFSRIEGALEKFSDRERKLLLIMFVSVSTMFVVLGTALAMGKISKLNEGIDEQRAVLTQLLAQRGEFLANEAAEEALNARLENNDLRFASFIEAQADNAGISSPQGFQDREQPIDDGRIIAVEGSTTFSGISIEDLDNFMQEVYASGEMVYVQRIEFQPMRRRNAEGLQVELTFVTYRLGDS